MDKDVINNKIESLMRCIERIKSHFPPSIEKLESDYDMQDIITLNLERAIQLCVDIASHIISDFNEPVPKTMALSFDSLAKKNLIPPELATNLSHAVGFRNIAVHQYEDISWKIVYSILNKNLSDFLDFARCIIEKISGSSQN